MTFLEFLRCLTWADYTAFTVLFVGVFVCGVMFSRHYFYDLGRIEAYRDAEKSKAKGQGVL